MPQITTLSEVEFATRLAWQPRLLDFTDAPLTEIVAEFNRRNPVQLVVADPTLGALRLSATFRSDNVEGFVHLMESDFGMRAEWRGEREVVLHRAR
jgi:transmembrane sensor